MKRMVMRILSMAIVFFTVVFAGCGGCGGTWETKSSISPGTYAFEADTYTSFLTLEASGAEKKEYNSAQTQASMRFSTTAKKYVWKEKKDWLFGKEEKRVSEFLFENCYLEIECKANGVTERTTVTLNSQGTATSWVSMSISPSYTVDSSYKIVGAGGEVYAKAFEGATFTYNGFTYEYALRSDGEYACALAKDSDYKTYKKDYKALYFEEYAYTEEGNKVPFLPMSILGERSKTFANGCSGDYTMKSVKRIILNGDFAIEDLLSERDLLGRESSLFSQLKEYFPNLEELAIKSLYSREEGTKSITFNFPEDGVKFYFEDNTNDKFFTSELSKAHFVTAYPFSDFNIAKYA